MEQEREDLRPFGWAPGWYCFKCCDCDYPEDADFQNAYSIGAKRSIRCEIHSRALAMKENKA